jgi:hypothetical protein
LALLSRDFGDSHIICLIDGLSEAEATTSFFTESSLLVFLAHLPPSIFTKESLFVVESYTEGLRYYVSIAIAAKGVSVLICGFREPVHSQFHPFTHISGQQNRTSGVSCPLVAVPPLKCVP